MVNTLLDISLLHALDGLSNQVLVAGIRQSRELLGPQRLEFLLDLAEDHLDRVVIWGVGDVVDEAVAEPPHLFLRFLGSVGREVVHEQADLVVAILGSHILTIFLEFVDVHRFLKDLVVF